MRLDFFFPFVPYPRLLVGLNSDPIFTYFEPARHDSSTTCRFLYLFKPEEPKEPVNKRAVQDFETEKRGISYGSHKGMDKTAGIKTDPAMVRKRYRRW